MDYKPPTKTLVDPESKLLYNNDSSTKYDTQVLYENEGTLQRSYGTNMLHLCVKGLRQNLILVLLLLSVVFGCAIGFGIRATGKLTKREIMYLQFPGEMLMRMLKMLILPLVVASLIGGIAGLDAKTCGKMGLRTMAYFGTTTLLAVILGIIMAVSIRPGANGDDTEIPRYGESKKLNSVDTFLDLIRNMFPDNLIVACYTAYKTDLKETITVENISVALENITSDVENTTEVLKESVTVEPSKGETGQSNILGLVVFSVCFGIVIGRMGEKGKPLLNFCNCVTECTMKLFVVFIWYSPIGITFLIAGKIVGMADFGVLMTRVGLYFLTVLFGLLIHGAVILPLLYFVLTRRNPYAFLRGILEAMATAFGTSSSSATMPVTLRCLETNNGIDQRVGSFVVPVGATINMDGTALYEAVAALFIAQVNDMDMSFGQIVTISITATAASIGAAGVPQAGLVTMVIVLAAVGLPIDDVTLILVVDWFLDRFRTMTNVVGDSIGAGIVYHLSKDELSGYNEDKDNLNLVRVDIPNGKDAITAV
ncbi:excitatory amino acid transporter 1-like [Saccostrea cucullata]|uniref:excitatory amino acid transporter 1-like n=1 Tax=Saccostrea cuccullata TaxID=36930 RepID=UPI002ED28E8F